MKEAKTWLFIRGLGRHTEHWADFIASFAKQFPKTKALGIDLPGMGEFRDLRSPLTVRENVDFVREQIKVKSLQGPFGVLAMSLGGMVAFDWALAYPEEVSMAALINMSTGSKTPFYQRLHWQSYLPFFGAVPFKKGAKKERLILDMTCNRKDVLDAIAQQWVEIDARSPLKVQNVLRQLTAAAKFRPGNSKLEVPTLLLVGLGDSFVDPECSIHMAEDWDLDVKTHPWGGHDLTTDDPLWVIDGVRDWSRNL